MDIHKKLPQYDIIGDVHGYIDILEQLLEKLGYTFNGRNWEHASRKAIFTGDFICRGPNSRSVLSCIRNMVENQTAHAILGNHELNAILFFTKSKELPLHEPGKASKELLLRFSAEYGRQLEQFDNDIRWLRTLPFFFEEDKFRVVHAYWNPYHIDILRNIHEDGMIRKKQLKQIAKKKGVVAKAAWETTRGIEFTMPADLKLKDSRNIMRNTFRIKWWQPMQGNTFREMSIGNRFLLPQYTIPAEIAIQYPVYKPSDPIVFVGHYCLGNQLIQMPNICCVDSCVALSGSLAAYRFDGESELAASKIIRNT